MPNDNTIALYGHRITVEPLESCPSGGARLDVETDDGRRTGELDTVITTWENGRLEDPDILEWMDDLLGRVAKAA